MKHQTMPFPSRTIPRLARVEQNLRRDHIARPRVEVREKLLAAGLAKRVRRGGRIAITAGSRGFGGFVELVAGIADAIKACGGKPFVIPSMGSHGGATADGQVEILRRLGVTERSVGAPIRSTMDTTELGRSETGAVAHLDYFAKTADGVIVLGRTQVHPENKTGIASGLLKMTTVGLGKQRGAQQAHNNGLLDSVAAVPRLTLAKSKVLFGVSMVENAFRQPAIIEAVPGTYEAFKEADQRLLKDSGKYFATIPFSHLDVLVVDEIGKNISGTGMDLNVIGNWRVKGGKQKPDFFRIVALSLTRESLGNALGIGLADFTTQRFLKEFDPASTWVNILTSTEPGALNTREGVVPLALKSDREAIQVALYSSLAGPRAKLCRIKNTGRLYEMWISETLFEEAEKNSDLKIVERPRPMRFDAKGNLF